MKAWLTRLSLPDEVHQVLALLQDEHLERVGCMSGALAQQLGTQDVQEARLGGLLHDALKLWVPRRVLLKGAPLDQEEWALMRRHPEEGALLLSKLWSACPEVVLAAVRDHHEREGGGGYPAGTQEALASLTATLAVADVWDALTTPRVYRPEVLSLHEVMVEMRRQCLPRLVVSVLPMAVLQLQRDAQEGYDVVV